MSLPITHPQIIFIASVPSEFEYLVSPYPIYLFLFSLFIYSASRRIADIPRTIPLIEHFRYLLQSDYIPYVIIVISDGFVS